MEFLVEFFPILLFVLYAVLRAISARSKGANPNAAPEGRADAPERPQPTGLDELTRHLELLVGGDLQSEPQRPKPKPEPRYEPEFQSSEAAIDESASFRHEEHGFGRENPLSEQVFESMPALSGSVARRDTPGVFDPHALKKTAEPSRTRSRWRERLASSSGAREAFVFKTIFERPGGRGR